MELTLLWLAHLTLFFHDKNLHHQTILTIRIFIPDITKSKLKKYTNPVRGLQVTNPLCQMPNLKVTKFPKTIVAKLNKCQKRNFVPSFFDDDDPIFYFIRCLTHLYFYLIVVTTYLLFMIFCDKIKN